jgi:hypothetical protein
VNVLELSLDLVLLLVVEKQVRVCVVKLSQQCRVGLLSAEVALLLGTVKTPGYEVLDRRLVLRLVFLQYFLNLQVLALSEFHFYNSQNQVLEEIIADKREHDEEKGHIILTKQINKATLEVTLRVF